MNYTPSYRCSCGTMVYHDQDTDQTLELDGVMHDHEDVSNEDD